MSKSMLRYYKSQAAQKKYLDALLTLTEPTPYDVILDVGTGSGTVSFFLAEREKKNYGIDPNQNFIEQNKNVAQQLIEAREVLPHFNVEFLALRAEDIKDQFSESYFDTIVCWGSVHHFKDYQKAMEGIRYVSKPEGKLIIFDAFFPEPVRDFWELASTIHDPTTVRHHTYFEYMEMLRESNFTPKTILSFRHRNNLDKWLSTINREDHEITAEIKSLHPGKYDEWLEKAHEKGLRQALREQILNLDEDKKAFMSIKDLGNGEYEFTYDTFVLLAEKEE